MNIAMILAGGQGLRMNTDMPKQFIKLGDIPILVRTLNVFDSCQQIDSICLVCLEEYIPTAKKLIKEYNINKISHIVPGGSDRRSSALNGLRAIRNSVADEDIVLIHDAARPNITHSIIIDNINAAIKYEACETVIASADTILQSSDGITADEILPRKTMYIVQTPQSFKYKTIYDAHLYYEEKYANKKIFSELPEITDDAGIILYFGKKVHLVKGHKMNIKVTQSEDLAVLEAAYISQNI